LELVGDFWVKEWNQNEYRFLFILPHLKKRNLLDQLKAPAPHKPQWKRQLFALAESTRPFKHKQKELLMATIEDPRRYFSKRQKQQLEVLGHLRSIFFVSQDSRPYPAATQQRPAASRQLRVSWAAAAWQLPSSWPAAALLCPAKEYIFLVFWTKNIHFVAGWALSN
jgi:hypothetical protein